MLKRKEEGKGASDGETRLLYPAKAAPGPCTRLARCGGRGFLMRACRLVVYAFKLTWIDIYFGLLDFVVYNHKTNFNFKKF